MDSLVRVMCGHVRSYLRSCAGMRLWSLVVMCVVMCGHVRSSTVVFMSCAVMCGRVFGHVRHCLGGMCGHVGSFNDYRIGRAGMLSGGTAG
jgi:hypothetical protein